MHTRGKEEVIVMAGANNIHYSKTRKSLYMGDRINLLELVKANRYNQEKSSLEVKTIITIEMRIQKQTMRINQVKQDIQNSS